MRDVVPSIPAIHIMLEDSSSVAVADVESRFIDLLEQRRNQNDLSWVTRKYKPTSAYEHCGRRPCRNPLEFRFKVLTDPNINAIVRRAYPNEPAALCFQRINDILTEVGSLKSVNVVRWLAFVLVKILKKVTDSVFINETKLLELRSNMGKNPVVFLPNHQSYADFIIMAFVCFNYDIEIPVVVAAMDFHAMFGVASLLRQCGAMYMRRSFKEDRVYQAIFKKYVQTVLCEGQSPFEFFIEGGRSRCGKSLMPKLGILKMIVEVYARRAVEDVTFITISLNFDRLMEDSLFVNEVIGAPKPKESTLGLLRGLGMLEKRYGNIYINVGDEMSLKEFHARHRPDTDLLSTLAHTIVRTQQNNIIITYFNVLSAVILHNLMRENDACLAITSLVDEVTTLKDILIAFGAHISWQNNENELRHALSLHEFLRVDQNGEFIRLPFATDRGSVREEVFDMVRPLILLQHYSNPCYHFLVSAACLVRTLSVETEMTRDELLLKYRFFCMLFKHEFLFHEAFISQSCTLNAFLKDFDAACDVLCRLKVVKKTHTDGLRLNDALAGGDASIWCSLMLPYLKGYLFVYQSLAQLSSRNIDKYKLVKTVQKRLELELELSDDLGLCYASSSHLICCAYSSLTDADVLHFDGLTNKLKVLRPDRLKAAESLLNYLLRKPDCNLPSSIVSSANKL